MNANSQLGYPPCSGQLNALVCMLALGFSSAGAQGLNALGTSGGLLSIPSARSLGDGTVAFGLSTAREPQLGPQSSPRNLTLGVGVMPGLEVVGRFIEQADRREGVLLSGVSDLSVNFKASLAWGHGHQPLHLALGLQDYGGAATNFRAQYAVATKAWGPWEATLGLGRSQGRGRVADIALPLSGAFGALRLDLPSSQGLPGQWSLHLEHDARQPVAGLQWTSRPTRQFADAVWSLGLHKAFAHSPSTPAANVLSASVTFPFGEAERRLSQFEPNAPRPTAGPRAAADTSTARLGNLKRKLTELGLERVQVGRTQDGDWVVRYQNRRFGHNELDALGLVVGLAAETAPTSVKAITAVAVRQGQAVLTLQTDTEAWRGFLRTGMAGVARGLTKVSRGEALSASAVDWLSDDTAEGTKLQVQLTPEVNHIIGNEIGAVHYALAARATVTVPLWTGGQLLAVVQQRLDQSRYAEPGRAYSDLLPGQGLQTLALHQTFWWGQRAVVGLAAGRFEQGAWGAEGDATFFMPGRDDVVRLRGRALQDKPALPKDAELAASGSYRWAMTPTTWTELAAQRYNDGSGGPSVVVTRWWGDVATHLFYRQGGWRKYAGVEFSIPLTPRAAPIQRTFHIEGTPSWKKGQRTMIANDANYVEPRKVQDLRLAWELDTQLLNAGRLGPAHVVDQLPRMREAFHTFAPKEDGL